MNIFSTLDPGNIDPNVKNCLLQSITTARNDSHKFNANSEVCKQYPQLFSHLQHGYKVSMTVCSSDLLTTPPLKYYLHLYLWHFKRWTKW